MNNKNWVAWKVQTAKKLEDISGVLKMTNIDFIDSDHQILVEYLLDLSTLIDKTESSYSLEYMNQIKELLLKTYDYVVEHLRQEEMFMEDYQLPNIGRHVSEHSKIIEAMKTTVNDYMLGKITINHKFKIQLLELLIKHINEVDYEFFGLDNWTENLAKAQTWKNLAPIVRKTGISEIDEQHEVLTVSILKAMVASDEGSIDEIEAYFDDYIHLAQSHFEFEEKFMTTYKIQDVGEHIERHKFFVQEAKRLKGRVLLKTQNIREMKVYLLRWWVNHINVTDKKTFYYTNWGKTLINEAESIDDLKKALRLTHVEAIDEEHTALMAYGLELSHKVRDCRSKGYELRDEKVKEDILLSFNKIYNYAATHFAHEESLMRKYGFKDIDRHCQEHVHLLQRIMDLKDNYKHDRLYMSESVNSMILKWWITHTNTFDYRSFVQNTSDKVLAEIRKEVLIDGE